MMQRPLKIGVEQALKKIRSYCAYRERNHKEVKQKLYSFGLYPKEVEQVLSTIIEENYLNEERYAVQYAGGKFRMNKWGRVKIKQAMLTQGISAYCIQKALAAIDKNEYEALFVKLAKAKLQLLKTERSPISRKAKLYAYLLQKGFEPTLINEFTAGHLHK